MLPYAAGGATADGSINWLKSKPDHDKQLAVWAMEYALCARYDADSGFAGPATAPAPIGPLQVRVPLGSPLGHIVGAMGYLIAMSQRQSSRVHQLLVNLHT